VIWIISIVEPPVAKSIVDSLGGLSIDRNPDAARVGWALFGLAAVLRLIGGVWAPWHINGLGSDWMLRPWMGEDPMAARYGSGYAELFSLPVDLLPLAPDHALFTWNVLIGAALAPLMFGLARRVGLGWRTAAVLGLVVAADPLAVRFCASEAYHPALAAGRHAAELALIAGASHLAAGRRGRAVGLWLVGVASAVGVARLHPIGWPLVAVAPLVLLAWPAPSLRWRLGGFVAAAASIVVGVLATGTVSVADLQGAMGSGPVSGTGGLAGLADGVRPWMLAAMIALALGLGWRRGIEGRRLGIPVVASLLGAALTWRAFTQADVWLASTLWLWAGWPLLAVVALWEPELERRLGPRTWRTAAALACAASVLVLFLARTAPATTDQAEYRWLRPHLVAQEPGCELRWLHRAERRWMSQPWHLLPDGVPPLRVHDGWATERPGACLLYLRSSLCSSAEGREECDRLEAQAVLEEVARATLPARPSYADLPYDREEVEVVLYRVRGAVSPEPPASPGSTPASSPTSRPGPG